MDSNEDRKVTLVENYGELSRFGYNPMFGEPKQLEHVVEWISRLSGTERAVAHVVFGMTSNFYARELYNRTVGK